MKISAIAIAILLTLCVLSVEAQTVSQNVILVTLDGVRTQEMFGGLDADVFKAVDKDYEKTPAFASFNAATAKERREKLMPYLWKTLIPTRGSIAGDRTLNSSVQTTNKMWFSYPGYSEMLTGQAHDDVIDSNGFGQNPYPSILDFLQKKLGLSSEQVADFSSWEVFQRIATSKPGSFVVNAGYQPYKTTDTDGAKLSRMQFLTLTPWTSVRHDYYTFNLAMSHMRKFHPRVLHIGLGETDDWAHGKNYERVLDALNQSDELFRQLFEFIDNDPIYKGKTTVIITTDHGRGATPKDWQDHGKDVPEAQNIWMAFFGPAYTKRGEWKDADRIFQNQIAATLCNALGVDYSENNKQAGKPVDIRRLTTH